MLKPIATVAFHTVRWSASAPENDAADEQREPQKIGRPPVNTCHVWAADGDLIRTEHPEFYRKD
jgi:endonuclease IV